MPTKGGYKITNRIVEEYDLADPDVWPDFESEKFARKKLREVIATLEEHNPANDEEDDIYYGNIGKRHRKHDKSYDKAIRILKACLEGRRDCQTHACPVCTRKYRRLPVSHALKAFENEEAFAGTFVPDPRPPYSVPENFNGRQFAEAFQERLRRCLPKAVRKKLKFFGYVELDINRKFKCFTPHIHFTVSGCTKDDLRMVCGYRLRTRNGEAKLSPPKSRIIKFPLVMKKLKEDDRVAWISYGIKSQRRNKDEYPTSQKKTPESRKAAKLRKQMAKVHGKQSKLTEVGRRTLGAWSGPKHGTAVQAELYNLLAQQSLHDLLVLSGIARVKVPRTLEWENLHDQDKRLRSKRR